MARPRAHRHTFDGDHVSTRAQRRRNAAGIKAMDLLLKALPDPVKPAPPREDRIATDRRHVTARAIVELLEDEGIVRNMPGDTYPDWLYRQLLILLWDLAND